MIKFCMMSIDGNIENAAFYDYTSCTKSKAQNVIKSIKASQNKLKIGHSSGWKYLVSL